MNDINLIKDYQTNKTRDKITTLMDRYENLIHSTSHYFMRNYVGTPIEFEDLVNITKFYFIELTENYDESRKMPFPSYIKRYLHFKVSNYMRQFTRLSSKINNSIGEFEELVYVENIEDDYSEVFSDKREQIEQVLNPMEQSIFNMLLQGKSYDEISTLTDKKHGAVYAYSNRIKCKLRNIFNEID